MSSECEASNTKENMMATKLIKLVTGETLLASVKENGSSTILKKPAMIAMIAAMNRPAELKVHLRGALANGCSAKEIREVLLLVTLYCGIPAGNDAHRLALEVLTEVDSSGQFK